MSKEIDEDLNNHQLEYFEVANGCNSCNKNSMTTQWSQLGDDLTKKKKEYGDMANKLKTFEEDIAKYDTWLNEMGVKVTSLSLLAWDLDELKQQKVDTQTLLDEVEAKYEKEFYYGINEHVTNLIHSYPNLDFTHIDNKNDEEIRKYNKVREQLVDRLTNVHKLIEINQRVSELMLMMDEIEQTTRSTMPTEVTREAFKRFTNCLQVMVDFISDRKQKFSDAASMISDYQVRFVRNSVVKEKGRILTTRCEQLLKYLAKQREDYTIQAKELRILEKNMAENDVRLQEMCFKINSLPPLTHGVHLLKQQEKETRVLLEEVEKTYEEDFCMVYTHTKKILQALTKV